jgi:hypothetical protein
MPETTTAIVRRALAGGGIELVASCGIDAYDARAPESYRSSTFLSGARGLVVAASAGTKLWQRFLARVRSQPATWEHPHPYDAFVAEILDQADCALRAAGIPFRRFDAALASSPQVNFRALGELVGLGRPGPFSMLIHEEHGPWWALRGAWLVAGEVEPALVARHPCSGCSAPCVGGWDRAGENVGAATPEVRGRCVVGQRSRYDDDQIGYHHDRETTVARLRARAVR